MTTLDDELIGRIAVGNGARFYPDGLEGPSIRMTITDINRDVSHALTNGLLANQHGSSIAPREKNGQLIPDYGM